MSLYDVHICSFDGPVYRYRGIRFMVSPQFGPVLVNMHGDPVNREPPRRLWQMWAQFNMLSPVEKKVYELRR